MLRFDPSREEWTISSRGYGENFPLHGLWCEDDLFLQDLLQPSVLPELRGADRGVDERVVGIALSIEIQEDPSQSFSLFRSGAAVDLINSEGIGFIDENHSTPVGCFSLHFTPPLSELKVLSYILLQKVCHIPLLDTFLLSNSTING